jgi:hypothetical protein
LRDFEKGQRKGQQFSRPWANDAEKLGRRNSSYETDQPLDRCRKFRASDPQKNLDGRARHGMDIEDRLVLMPTI